MKTLAVISVVLLALARPVWALDSLATCTDAGVRAAVTATNNDGGGTVTFDCSDTTILMTAPIDDLDGDVIIDGEDNNITLQWDKYTNEPGWKGRFLRCETTGDLCTVAAVNSAECSGGTLDCIGCNQGEGWPNGPDARQAITHLYGSGNEIRNIHWKYWLESIQILSDGPTVITGNTFTGHYCSDDAVSSPGTDAAMEADITHNKMFTYWDKAMQLDRGTILVDGNVIEDTVQPIRINNVTNETPGTYTITNNIMRWTDDTLPLFSDAISNCNGPYFTEVAHITFENNLVNCLRGVRIGSGTPLCDGGIDNGKDCADVTGDTDCDLTTPGDGLGDCEYTSEVEVNMLGNTIVGRINALVPYESVGWESRFGVSMEAGVVVSFSDNWIQYGGENAGGGNAGGVIFNDWRFGTGALAQGQTDLGAGSLSMLGTTVVSTGGNIIKLNAEDSTTDNRDVRNLVQGYTMKAEENCWRGTTLGEVADDVDDVNDDAGNGTVDFDPLATDSCTGALLDVTVVSPSGGTVTGTGINCPGDCANTGADVPYVLTATPTGANTIGEWSGYGCNACQTGDETCYVWIDSTNCEVEFLGPDCYVDQAFGPGGDGTADTPYDTVAECTAAVVPGQTVYVVGATYAETLIPTAGNSIGDRTVYSCLSGTCTMNSINGADGADYIEVDGFTFTGNSNLWEDGNGWWVHDCIFVEASVATSCGGDVAPNLVETVDILMDTEPMRNAGPGRTGLAIGTACDVSESEDFYTFRDMQILTPRNGITICTGGEDCNDGMLDQIYMSAKNHGITIGNVGQGVTYRQTIQRSFLCSALFKEPLDHRVFEDLTLRNNVLCGGLTWPRTNPGSITNTNGSKVFNNVFLVFDQSDNVGMMKIDDSAGYLSMDNNAYAIFNPPRLSGSSRPIFDEDGVDGTEYGIDGDQDGTIFSSGGPTPNTGTCETEAGASNFCDWCDDTGFDCNSIAIGPNELDSTATDYDADMWGSTGAPYWIHFVEYVKDTDTTWVPVAWNDDVGVLEEDDWYAEVAREGRSRLINFTEGGGSSTEKSCRGGTYDGCGCNTDEGANPDCPGTSGGCDTGGTCAFTGDRIDFTTAPGSFLDDMAMLVWGLADPGSTAGDIDRSTRWDFTPVAGSPLIDAGDNANCAVTPADGNCDIGPVERGGGGAAQTLIVVRPRGGTVVDDDTIDGLLIDCGDLTSDCSETGLMADVTLDGSATTDWVFRDWLGETGVSDDCASCTTTETNCVAATGTADKTCMATYETDVTLTVTDGCDAGTNANVSDDTSESNRIVACTGTGTPGAECTGTYPGGEYLNETTVQLTAAFDSGCALSQWLGCDSSTATTCDVNIDDADQTVELQVQDSPTTTPTVEVIEVFRDDSNVVKIEIKVDDPNNDAVDVRVDYHASTKVAPCFMGAGGGEDPTLANLTGGGSLDNGQTYQIQNVDTSGGEVTLNVEWTNPPGKGTGTAGDQCVRFLPNDGTADGSAGYGDTGTTCTQAAMVADLAIANASASGYKMAFNCVSTQIDFATTGLGTISGDDITIHGNGQDITLAYEDLGIPVGGTPGAGECKIGDTNTPAIAHITGSGLTVQDMTFDGFAESIQFSVGSNGGSVLVSTFTAHPCSDDALSYIDGGGDGDPCDGNIGDFAVIGNTFNNYTDKAIQMSCGDGSVTGNTFNICKQPMRAPYDNTPGGGTWSIVSNIMTGDDTAACDGPYFSGGGRYDFINNTLQDCRRGLLIGHSTDAAEGGGVEMLVQGNTIHSNRRFGIVVTGESKAKIYSNTITENGALTGSLPNGGVILWDGGGSDTPEMDLGGGSVSIGGDSSASLGKNILQGNDEATTGGTDAVNVRELLTSGGSVKAEDSCWDSAVLATVEANEVEGTVDVDPLGLLSGQYCVKAISAGGQRAIVITQTNEARKKRMQSRK